MTLVLPTWLVWYLATVLVPVLFCQLLVGAAVVCTLFDLVGRIVRRD